MEVFVLGIQNHVSTLFQTELVSEIGSTSFRSGALELNQESPYYPNRSDEKIMRQDTKAAVILMNELLDSSGQNLDRETMSLFVATGVFVDNLDKHLGHLTSVFEQIQDTKTESDKIYAIYRASPPLLALQTLTNSTMSFIAQYTGVKGNNATFGTTSLSGFQAIQEGVNDVIYSKKNALICASNASGIYSYLTHSTLYESKENWCESAAVGGILLGSQNFGNAHCKITALRQAEQPVNFADRFINNDWESLLPNKKADQLIFTGAFTDLIYEADMEFCLTLNSEAKSPFKTVGNSGPANAFIALEMGISALKAGCKIIDLLDRDIYGRSSLIRIEAI